MPDPSWSAPHIRSASSPCSSGTACDANDCQDDDHEQEPSAGSAFRSEDQIRRMHLTSMSCAAKYQSTSSSSLKLRSYASSPSRKIGRASCRERGCQYV